MMTEGIASIVIEALTRIAPEVDPSAVESSRHFRDQLDLDSMDFLNFVQALHARLGIDIPEADYLRLCTLESAVAYLSARLAQVPPSPVTRDPERD